MILFIKKLFFVFRYPNSIAFLFFYKILHFAIIYVYVHKCMYMYHVYAGDSESVNEKQVTWTTQPSLQPQYVT